MESEFVRKTETQMEKASPENGICSESLGAHGVQPLFFREVTECSFNVKHTVYADCKAVVFAQLFQGHTLGFLE